MPLLRASVYFSGICCDLLFSFETFFFNLVPLQLPEATYTFAYLM